MPLIKTPPPKKSHLINSEERIFTGTSCLFNTTQARCQGDLQIMLTNANIPGQEPSGTDTAHKNTGSKHAKAMCVLETVSLLVWQLLLALCSTTTTTPCPKEVQSYPINDINLKKDQGKNYCKESPPHMIDSTPVCGKQNTQNKSKYKHTVNNSGEFGKKTTLLLSTQPNPTWRGEKWGTWWSTLCLYTCSY